MRTFLLTAGLDKLIYQDQTPAASPLQFTGFTAGNANSFVITPSNQTIPGFVYYTGDDSDMEYIPVSPDEVIIKCYVPRASGPYVIGNITLLADGVPFCVTVAQQSWLKEVTTQTQVGALYCFQISINIPQLFNRFSFVNLNMNKVSMFEAVDQNSIVTYPWEEAHEQFVIKNDTRINKPLLVVNAWNDYWASPTMTHVDSENFMVLFDDTAI